ncbi:hypothetical protein GGTG_14144 [Gaeumannomyces tritici R3-111a-1]|uniref:Uncharacterized protein n=1 Tax=Gaeumannomyces tritici (strain R3-111a-1) TaxID=644352 RepID=J3PKS7_GAET3|nr:hypothetical protein GGTG_14144 [Gaeumannomyces tritici R3-111a-1]EJT68277.1 hypothetical protein GGTG_14144 [Gaeumannomyces tritici R3-111a-1]
MCVSGPGTWATKRGPEGSILLCSQPSNAPHGIVDDSHSLSSSRRHSEVSQGREGK